MINIRKKHDLTEFGAEVKKRLIDKGMTQREFCRRYGINASMLSYTLHTGEYKRLERHVARILGIRWVA